MYQKGIIMYSDNESTSTSKTKEIFLNEMKEKLDNINNKVKFQLDEIDKALSNNQIQNMLNSNGSNDETQSKPVMDDIIKKIKDWNV